MMSKNGSSTTEFKRRLIQFLDVITSQSFQDREKSSDENRPEDMCNEGRKLFELLYMNPMDDSVRFLVHYPRCSQCYQAFKAYLEKIIP